MFFTRNVILTAILMLFLWIPAFAGMTHQEHYLIPNKTVIRKRI